MRLDLKSRSRLMIFFLGLNAMVSGSNACLAQSTGGVNSLAADLRNGFKQNLNSYQRALWYAYHAIIETLDGKEWIQIRPSLEAQQFHIEDMCSGGPGTRRYEITLPGLGYQPPSGPVHPLIIDLNTSQNLPGRLLPR